MSRRPLLLALAAQLVACAGTVRPTGPAPRFDVFHDVYLRGGPAEGAQGRLALSVEGLDACTETLVAALRGPSDDPDTHLRATFFLDRGSLTRAADRDPAGLKDLLRRMVAEGHAFALFVPELPSAWRTDPAAFRRGVRAQARAVAALLRAHGVDEPELLRLWRPAPAAATDLKALGRAADVERPLVLWSLRAPAGSANEMAAHLSGRLADGDIVALPGGGEGCPVAELAPALRARLAEAKLRTVTVHELLGRSLARHLPARLVRYRGPGLPASCDAALGVPPAGDDEAAAERWGLVVDGEADAETLTVLPLPGRAASTARLLEHDLEVARALWRKRARWRGLPACLRQVRADRLRSPVTPERDDATVGWWVVDDDGRIARRDARALDDPGRAVVLPARPNLVRLEARQRLPWRLRGLVAGALEKLGLEAPLLVEIGATSGVVVGQTLTPADLQADPARLQAAISGFVQLVEVSLGEYLFLADRNPRSADRLDRAARAAEGFVRAGPFLTVPVAPGGSPQPETLGPDGRSAFAERSPVDLLRRVLQAGRTLRPGDVVAAAPPPVFGAPPAIADPEVVAFRSVERSALSRSIVRGLAQAVYLRPGGVVEVDGDLLGRQTLRVAVPPGVAAPVLDAGPLVDQVEPEGEGARR